MVTFPHSSPLSSSFPLPGLPADEQASDGARIERVCSDDLQVSVSCKRIGRQLPGKPRRLLVYLRSRDQAQKIIQSAKLLRQSEDSCVRENVYINPNFTEAEAKAQFEIRQRRRQKDPISKGTQSGSSTQPIDARRMNNNILNPEAAGFTPAVSAVIAADRAVSTSSVPVVGSP